MSPSSAASSNDDRARTGRRILAVIAVMFAPPLLGLNVPRVVAAVRAQRWPTARATIRDQYFTDERTTGDARRLHVQYDYAYGGDAYSGSHITPAGLWTRSTDAARRRYAVGTVLTVHVSPDDPKLAALDVALPWGAVALSLVGLAVLGWGIRLLLVRQDGSCAAVEVRARAS